MSSSTYVIVQTRRATGANNANPPYASQRTRRRWSAVICLPIVHDIGNEMIASNQHHTGAQTLLQRHFLSQHLLRLKQTSPACTECHTTIAQTAFLHVLAFRICHQTALSNFHRVATNKSGHVYICCQQISRDAAFKRAVVLESHQACIESTYSSLPEFCKILINYLLQALVYLGCRSASASQHLV